MRISAALVVLIGTAAVMGRIIVTGQQPSRPPGIQVEAISTDAAHVTGGDVLVEVKVSASSGPLRVTAAGRDVTAAFKPGSTPTSRVGLVTGLPDGPANIVAESGGARATLEVTNYPITGPVMSGPWIKPFVCQTASFKLPDGSSLGAPLDQNCSAKTVVQYVYRSSAAKDNAETNAVYNAAPSPTAFTPLRDLSKLPADVAKTTTSTGQTVNFVVRVETGTMNRGIYQNAILHDPTTDPPVSLSTPPRGWNRRLVALHGVGCTGGWFIQGSALGATVLDLPRLAKGYAVYNNTLNHAAINCNPVLAAETAMMGKEHFIETFGAPFYTLTTGRSGGAYTSLQIADALPGLFDGVAIGGTFPDAATLAIAALDARLVEHYWRGHFARTQAVSFTRPLGEQQLVAITGFGGRPSMIDNAVQASRTDPVPGRIDMTGYRSARWNGAVPDSEKYDPVKNPRGARPTIWDAARNVYGVDASGAAHSPFDNVGVQYGLDALNTGAISVQQFLDMNEFIGGYDRDTNYVATRTAANPDVLKRAYQSGVLLGANGGLRSIPIFVNATPLASDEEGYHNSVYHFIVRERLRQANGGRPANMVMWRSDFKSNAISPVDGGPYNRTGAEDMVDQWMTAFKSDKSADPPEVKAMRAKPKGVTDGCYDTSTPPKFIAEDLLFSSKPDSQCSALYPVYRVPRLVAGAPPAANILKCQVKPVDMKDYTAKFTPQEQARLAKVFAEGVCDWSKPGVGQTPVVPWASFGPSQKNLVFKLEAPGLTR